MRLTRHNRADWPIPAGWRVRVQPDQVQLAPSKSAEITVDITSPDGFRGRQVVNVNALDGSELVGGVSLSVEGNG